jgi:hypothetical protein
LVALHGNAVLCTFFDENEVCYAAGCSVIYHLLLMSSAAIFTSSEVHLARLALFGRLQLSLSWPIQSDHLSITNQMIPALEQEHSHGKTQHIPGKQVLVRS